jgi:3-deoxy-D-arabino-heptulosonate 7-phosphate (DAHP) synthase
MNAADTKNASPLFTNVRRSRGREVLVAGAVLIAAYLGVASVLIENYERPDVAVVMAGG